MPFASGGSIHLPGQGPMKSNIELMVCSHSEAEARAVLAGGGSDLDGVSLLVYPGRCGRPPLGTAQLRDIVPVDATSVEILGSACLNSLKQASAPGARCNPNCARTCFDMFVDRTVVDRLLKEGAYLLTSGWLANWRDRVGEWGFEQESLRCFLRETSSHFRLLDTGVDPKSLLHLAELGEYAGCPVKVTHVGLGFFELYVKQIIQKRRYDLLAAHTKHKSQLLAQKASDYAMAIDLLGQVAAIHDERDAIRRMLDVFTMLIAPRVIVFVIFADERPMAMYSPGHPLRPPDPEVVAKLSDLDSQVAWDEKDGTYRIRIAHADKLFGVVLMSELACPEYAPYYRNLITSIVPICGLAIGNARTYEEVSRTGEALKRANRELTRLAVTDELTQVGNRRQFDEVLQTEWRRAMRRRTPVSLLMMDIDHFKSFNDRWGHQAGDRCLKEVAQILAGCATRAGDLVARYGGEEFAAILPTTPSEGARHVAERMRTAIERSRIAHGESPVGDDVTLSIGYASVVPASADGARELIASADCALYAAKHLGRNRCIEAMEDLEAAPAPLCGSKRCDTPRAVNSSPCIADPAAMERLTRIRSRSA